jgi:hypothetical protein
LQLKCGKIIQNKVRKCLPVQRYLSEVIDI